jgi:peptidoglycan/LPS O-acetylase OafA/YrhL
MIHNIIFLVLIKRVLLNNDLDSWILYTVVYLGVTILLSILSFEYLEKPFLKFKGKFTRIETRKF